MVSKYGTPEMKLRNVRHSRDTNREFNTPSEHSEMDTYVTAV